MTIYYRWTSVTSSDARAALAEGRLQYVAIHGKSRKAVWVFNMSAGYKPGGKFSKDRVLLAIEMKDEGASVIESKSNHIDFEDTKFKGEAKHPDLIIVKSNEPGARGIGIVILARNVNPHIKKIRQADRKEYAKALGLKEKEIQWKKWQPKPVGKT